MSFDESNVAITDIPTNAFLFRDFPEGSLQSSRRLCLHEVGLARASMLSHQPRHLVISASE
jgi:hypothetical protein